MEVYSLCLAIATVWLLMRLYNFLSFPVSKIVTNLDVKIPPAVKVSIDKITNNSITLHWENEPIDSSATSLPNNITHYMLYINSVQVGVFPNSPKSLYTCCSIANLKSQKQYQLDFITVNNMGFINKLPSIFCMTKNSSAPNNIKTRKWRRNTLTTSEPPIHSTNGTGTSSVVTTNTDDKQTLPNAIPSYNSLTTLQDLECFSIDDLKKILICSQEDLHDVLTYQKSLLQDFQESREELQFELDNLKVQWSHEIDFRKSMKSNIKSLENSKLLSDLKFDKLNQKIIKTKEKISKMNNDIENWSIEESEQLNQINLQTKYEIMIKDSKVTIENLSNDIKKLQQDISLQEGENKKLNILKKTSSSTNLESLNAKPKVQPQQFHESKQLSVIIKKINEYTSEKTGLLNNQGEEYLSKLNENSPIVKLIKDQLSTDKGNENKWRSTRARLIKKINSLESNFNEMSTKNRQLRAGLIAQPYKAKNEQQSGSSNTTPILLSNISSNNNNESTVSNTSLDSSQQHNTLPLMSSFLNSNSSSNTTSNNNNTSPAMNRSPNLNGQSLLYNTVDQQRFLTPMSSEQGSLLTSQILGEQNNISNAPVFPRSVPTTSTAMTNATAHSATPVNHSTYAWGFSPQPQNQETLISDPDGKTELDQAFEYDNANHLITGLQDMIYDEAEYPDSISNYSKGFTTDQLDNYWTNQKPSTTQNQSTFLPRPEHPAHQTPMSQYTNDFMSPMSPSPLLNRVDIRHTSSSSGNQLQQQSLLGTTLGDSKISSPFADGLSLQHTDSFYRSENPSNNLNNIISNNVDDIMSLPNALSPHNSNSVRSPQSNMIGTFNNEIQTNDISLSKTPEESNESLLQSPSFNFLWHSMSPTKNKKQNSFSSNFNSNSEPMSAHKRNKSNSSNGSSWSNKLSLKGRSTAQPSTSPATLQEGMRNNSISTEGSQPSTGRKMSRLLSRSTMNNLFKKPNHGSHPNEEAAL